MVVEYLGKQAGVNWQWLDFIGGTDRCTTTVCTVWKHKAPTALAQENICDALQRNSKDT